MVMSMMSMIEDVYCFVAQLEDFTEGHVSGVNDVNDRRFVLFCSTVRTLLTDMSFSDVNEVNDRRCVLFCSTVRRLY